MEPIGGNTGMSVPEAGNGIVAPVRPGMAWVRGIDFPTSLLVLLVLAGVWEASSRSGLIQAILLPPPSLVLTDLVTHWRLFAAQGGITLVEIVTGFLASMLFAIPLAVLLGASRTLEKMLYPLLVASQTVPVVSIAPILLAWFGFGLKPKIIVVVLITFFPVMMNAFAGMKSMSEQIHHLARSMGATRFQLFWHFQLPGALPHIFAGMKIATTLAVVGAIVAEFVGSDSGLGYEITVAGSNLDLAHQFAAIFVLSAMGLTLFAIMSRIERLCLPWHISVRGARGGREG
jgi:NitT/TauT family transport system permease protein